MLEGLGDVDAVVPVNHGSVTVKKQGNVLEITADCAGGTLLYKGEEIPLSKDKTVSIAV